MMLKICCVVAFSKVFEFCVPIDGKAVLRPAYVGTYVAVVGASLFLFSFCPSASFCPPSLSLSIHFFLVVKYIPNIQSVGIRSLHL